MDQTQAVNFLTSILGKRLRVTTTDTRVFVGEMKCTDRDRNVILAGTHEYRPPSVSAVAAAAETAQASGDPMIKMDMASRYMGLVVVPGHHITKIEVEGEL
ncbi:MAG: hypothetical protein M1838_000315 [Thelocarpon superellum]|nr:MAG: hypothetical protein M1838_000315 [Thelocarpon superellum]